MKKIKPTQKKAIHNPVAKFAHKSNRCVTHKDKTQYNRSEGKLNTRRIPRDEY